MVARARLLDGLRTLLTHGAIFLVPLVVFPWLATWMRADLTHLDLWRAWGTRLALTTPLLLVGLGAWRYRSLRTGHHRAQAALEGGARLVLLPRADGKPVRADRVRFWGRVVDLLPTCQHVAVEVQADSTGVQLVAVVPQMLRGAFLTQLASEWPGTRARTLTRQEDHLETGTGRAGWSVTLCPRSRELPLLATAEDPLLAPLTELSRLPEGVAAGVQMVVRSDPYSRRRLGGRAYKRLGEQSRFTSLASRRTTKLLDERAQHAFLEVELRVWAHAGTEGLARRTAESLARSLCAQYEPSNPLLRMRTRAGLPASRAFGMFRGTPWTEAELGQLAHLVGADVLAYVPTLATASARALPPPAVARGPARGVWRSPRFPARSTRGGASAPASPRGGAGVSSTLECRIVWGTHEADSGDEFEVDQPLADLTTHLLVSGTTGSGKSTLLRNLALQAADAGATVIVIEPHGDLVLHPTEGILAALTDDQLRRTTVVDLASAWPPQLNLVTSGIAAGRSVAVQVAMRTIRTMDDASYSVAIQMRAILENALYVLLSAAARDGTETSLLHLQQFLEERTYRESVIGRAGADALEAKRFWDRTLAEWAERKGGGAEILAVPLRRTSQFLRDERFRRSLALPTLAPELALDIGALLDGPEPRLLLVPLQGQRLGEAAKRVFGSLFLQAVTSTLLARGASGKARRQTLIIIDEFPDFAGEEMGELVKTLLAQARKFGASVVLGTQFLAQLPRDVQAEVRTNCNNKIALATQDARDAGAVVEAMGSPLLGALDVQNVEKWHGYARLRVHQAPQPPFYFRALPPLPAFPGGSRVAAGGQGRRPPPGLETLDALHLRANGRAAEAVVNTLTRLDQAAFADLVRQQVAANHYAAQRLLETPDLEPDPVRRALFISRARHGLPWWFYEAQYRRLRAA